MGASSSTPSVIIPVTPTKTTIPSFSASDLDEITKADVKDEARSQRLRRANTVKNVSMMISNLINGKWRERIIAILLTI